MDDKAAVERVYDHLEVDHVDKPVIIRHRTSWNLRDLLYAARFSKSSSREVMSAEPDYLTMSARKLHDVASKGVHVRVTGGEAGQGFYWAVYVVLPRPISVPSCDLTIKSAWIGVEERFEYEREAFFHQMAWLRNSPRRT